jgi:hypothetical protein
MKKILLIFNIFISINSYSQHKSREELIKMIIDADSSSRAALENAPSFSRLTTYNIYDYPEYFEYEKSPCYDKLGWSPTYPKIYWDRKYELCEKNWRNRILGNTVFIIFILGGIFTFVYFSYYKPRKDKTDENN